MRSRPWRELVEEELEPRAWLWEGFVSRGSVVALSAAPKAGKTTLTAELVRSLASGRPEFLGARLEQSHVLYVSEESRHEWQERGAGHQLDGVHVIPREQLVGASPWDELVPELGAEAEELGCGLLVLDTFRKLAKLPDGGENDAGTIQRALEPCLELAASRGLGVLLLHHNRKGGGEHGEGASGSTAFVGALDALLTMTRNGEHPTRRRLEVLARWPAPDELILDHTPAGYMLLGTRGEVAAGDRGDRVARLAGEVLEGLVGTGKPATLRELDERHEGHRKLMPDALALLIERSQVARSGRGVKGDPYVFDSVPPPALELERIESGPVSTFAERELEL